MTKFPCPQCSRPILLSDLCPFCGSYIDEARLAKWREHLEATGYEDPV